MISKLKVACFGAPQAFTLLKDVDSFDNYDVYYAKRFIQKGIKYTEILF